MSLVDLRKALGPHGHCKLTWNASGGWVLTAAASDGTLWAGNLPANSGPEALEGLFDRCCAVLAEAERRDGT